MIISIRSRPQIKKSNSTLRHVIGAFTGQRAGRPIYSDSGMLGVIRSVCTVSSFHFTSTLNRNTGYVLPFWLIYIFIQTPFVIIRHLEDLFCKLLRRICAFPCPRGGFTFWFMAITAAVNLKSALFPTKRVQGGGARGRWILLISPNALLQVWAE